MTASSIEPSPRPDEPGHEFYEFMDDEYDVTRALEMIALTPGRPTVALDVASTARTLGLEKSSADYLAEGVVHLLRGHVDEEYALTHADLARPVLLADLAKTGDPAHMLIDGYHRVRRAYAEGLVALRAHMLTREESAQIRRTRRFGSH
jgi:hypothetical protein